MSLRNCLTVVEFLKQTKQSLTSVDVCALVRRGYHFSVVPLDIGAEILNAGPTIALVCVDFSSPFDNPPPYLATIFVATGFVASGIACFVAISGRRHPEKHKQFREIWQGLVSAAWVQQMVFDLTAYTWVVWDRMMGVTGEVDTSLELGITAVVLPSFVLGLMRFIYGVVPLKKVISSVETGLVKVQNLIVGRHWPVNLYPTANLCAAGLGAVLICIEEISNWSTLGTFTDLMGLTSQVQHFILTIIAGLLSAGTTLVQIDKSNLRALGLEPRPWTETIERIGNYESSAGIFLAYILYCLAEEDMLGGPIGLAIQLFIAVAVSVALLKATANGFLNKVSDNDAILPVISEGGWPESIALLTAINTELSDVKLEEEGLLLQSDDAARVAPRSPNSSIAYLARRLSSDLHENSPQTGAAAANDATPANPVIQQSTLQR